MELNSTLLLLLVAFLYNIEFFEYSNETTPLIFF